MACLFVKEKLIVSWRDQGQTALKHTTIDGISDVSRTAKFSEYAYAALFFVMPRKFANISKPAIGFYLATNVRENENVNKEYQ